MEDGRMAADGILTVLAIVGLALIPVLVILIAIAVVKEVIGRYVQLMRFGPTVVLRSSFQAQVPLDEEQLTAVIRELLRTARKAEAIELYQFLREVDAAEARAAVEA